MKGQGRVAEKIRWVLFFSLLSAGKILSWNRAPWFRAAADKGLGL